VKNHVKRIVKNDGKRTVKKNDVTND